MGWVTGEENNQKSAFSDDCASELRHILHLVHSSLGRTHINSCDFSVASYSHDDTEDDLALSDFDTLVTHDLNSGMIDMMLSATSTLKSSYPNEEGMKIFASPWSPPSWMKAPSEQDKKEKKNATHAVNMTGSAEPVCIRDGVGKESVYAKSWALFFSKWLDACEYFF